MIRDGHFVKGHFQQRATNIFLIIITIILCLLSMVQSQGNEMARLRKRLFEDQHVDRHNRPVQNHTDTVSVELLFDLANIHSMDEWTGTLTVNGFVRLIWEDQLFRWDPEEFGGLDHIIVPQNTVWQPDVTLYNSAQAVEMDHYGNSMLYLTSDGLVHWFPPVTFRATCPIDHKLFPFDEHSCPIVLGSWTYDTAAVNLQLAEEHNDTQVSLKVSLLEHISENPQWELLSIIGKTREIHQDCCAEKYRIVEYKINIRRRAPFYKFLLVVPCVLTVGLTLALFWLPPNAGEKITVGGIALIIQVALLFFLGWCIPPGGLSVPTIVLFCGNSLVITGLSLIISVVVINLSRSRNYTPVPAYLKMFLGGWIQKVLCLGLHPYQVASSKLLDDNHVELGDPSELSNGMISDHRNHFEMKPSVHIDWILLATAIDRIFFIVYCIAYVFILVTSLAR